VVTPRLALVDLDGTLLSVSSEKLFLEHLAGKRMVTAGGLLRFALGYLLHPARTIREGKGWNRLYLRGLGADAVKREAAGFARNELLERIRPDVAGLLDSLSGNGCRTVVVSASLVYLAEAVAEAVNAHRTVASVPEEREGILTGSLAGPRPWGRDKAETGVRICREEGVELSECMALGDSWPDRHLMLACGEAVAVHPSARLARLAAGRGWSILEGRHTRWA
jgi:HAD superfamily phosphoserine phosphatase-like hydrolase